MMVKGRFLTCPLMRNKSAFWVFSPEIKPIAFAHMDC